RRQGLPLHGPDVLAEHRDLARPAGHRCPACTHAGGIAGRRADHRTGARGPHDARVRPADRARARWLRPAAAPRQVIARRSLGALAIVLASGIAPARAEDLPVVPLLSFFAHWDHHWYVWLKGDPTYEAVEVMSRQRGTEAPQVWVFFTERAA